MQGFIVSWIYFRIFVVHLKLWSFLYKLEKNDMKSVFKIVSHSNYVMSSDKCKTIYITSVTSVYCIYSHHLSCMNNSRTNY